MNTYRGRSLSRAPRKRARYVSRSRSRSLVRSQPRPIFTTEGQFQRAPYSYGITRVQRSWDAGALSIPANAGTGDGFFTFQLGTLSGASEITNMYSQYRVDRIVLTFIPLSAESMLFTCIDYNDQTVLTKAQITERDNCHITPPGVNFTVSYKPRIGYDVEDTIGSVPSSGFINSANTTINHLGLKYAVTRSTNATQGATQTMYRAVGKVYLSLRNAK